MIHQKEKSLLGLTLAVLLIGLLICAVLPAPAVEADLPGRATPTPIPQKDKDDGPLGAWIELQVSGAADGAWAGVQWHCPSDGCSAGGWENVDGWQGPLPHNTRWWVAAKDFGAGPFRWVITQGQGGPELGASEPFNLPGGANETRVVGVTIK